MIAPPKRESTKPDPQKKRKAGRKTVPDPERLKIIETESGGNPFKTTDVMRWTGLKRSAGHALMDRLKKKELIKQSPEPHHYVICS